MSRIVGTVTRKTGNTIVEAQQTAQGNVACFVARSADGSKIGDFRNAGSGRAAVQSTGGKLLRWTREDLPGSIERHVARGALLDPLDIYGSGLLLEWNEADVGVVLTPATTDIVLIGDQAQKLQNLTQPTLANQPTRLAAGAGGIPTIDFVAASAHRLLAPAILDPANDLIITLVAVIDAVGAQRDIFATDIASTIVISVSGAGFFIFANSLGVSTSAVAAVPGQPYVIQLVYRAGPPLSMELYINGTLATSNAGTFTANTISYYGGLTAPWDGKSSLLVIAQDASDQNRELVRRYANKRYLQ